MQPMDLMYDNVPKDQRTLENFYSIRLDAISDFSRSVVNNAHRNQWENDPVDYLGLALMAVKTVDQYCEELQAYIQTLETRLKGASES